MTQKKETPLKVSKGANNAQVAKTTQATKTEVKPTFDELQRENEELKKKLAFVPSDLDSKIQYFNHKKELIKKLNLLNDNKDELNRHLDNISELSAQNDFVNDRYKINIVDADQNYNSRDVFNIKNPVIVGEVMTFILGRIEAKQKELKKEIEA